MHGRIGTVTRLFGLGVLVAAGLGLGGCRNVSKGEYDMVLQENQELRDRLAGEQGSRQELETRNASLEQENRDLASRQTQAGGKPGAGGATGFEGSGWDSYRTAGGEVVVSALGDVLFDSGRATLKSSAKTSLNQIASVIKSKYTGQVIRVEGYSDTDPIKKSNWKTNERLSGERAMAVEEYLTSRGLSKDQIYYAGFGSSRPKENKAKSRRVEIVILAAGQ
jgi:chemotaxis protein MotB